MSFFKKMIISALALGLFVIQPNNILKVDAKDDREVIETIKATSDFIDPYYGGKITNFTFNQTEGEPAYFSLKSHGWENYNAGNWKEVDDDYFTPGKWRYFIYIVLDDDAYSNFRLSENVEIFINDKLWEVTDIYGQEIKVAKEFSVTKPDSSPLELKLKDPIIVGYVNEEIKKQQLALSVFGGKKPYTFTKVSGPNWLNINEESGEITGTPTEVKDNTDLKVKIKDDNEEYIEVSIKVLPTLNSKADRTVVDEIKFTSDFRRPVVGEFLWTPKFTGIEDNPTKVIYFNNTWLKFISEEEGWQEVDTGRFTEGKWFYSLEVWMQDANKFHYVFSDDAKIFVNGVLWDIQYRRDDELLAYSEEFDLKITYEAVHKFISKDKDLILPKEVLDLLPENQKGLKQDDTVSATLPSSTKILVPNGSWEFVGYDLDTVTILSDNVTFIGYWNYVADPLVDTDEETKSDDEDKKADANGNDKKPVVNGNEISDDSNDKVKDELAKTKESIKVPKSGINTHIGLYYGTLFLSLSGLLLKKRKK